MAGLRALRGLEGPGRAGQSGVVSSARLEFLQHCEVWGKDNHLRVDGLLRKSDLNYILKSSSPGGFCLLVGESPWLAYSDSHSRG